MSSPCAFLNFTPHFSSLKYANIVLSNINFYRVTYLCQGLNSLYKRIFMIRILIVSELFITFIFKLTLLKNPYK